MVPFRAPRRPTLAEILTCIAAASTLLQTLAALARHLGIG